MSKACYSESPLLISLPIGFSLAFVAVVANGLFQMAGVPYVLLVVIVAPFVEELFKSIQIFRQKCIRTVLMVWIGVSFGFAVGEMLFKNIPFLANNELVLPITLVMHPLFTSIIMLAAVRNVGQKSPQKRERTMILGYLGAVLAHALYNLIVTVVLN